jgi:hypothetical protein
VLWDAIRARIARGKTADEAVAELELQRAGRSLNKLVDELKQRRQYRQESPERLRGGARGRIRRGQAQRGRYGRWGRRGGMPGRELPVGGL